METERLYLRRFSEADWADLYEYLSDEKVVKYEPYGVHTEEECKEVAKKRAASEAFWAVCLKANNKLIGNIYLAKGEQDTWTLGYVFNYNYQKKGYATEAAKEVINHAFNENKAHRIQAYCNPKNESSWMLLARLGFQKEAHFRRNVYFNCDENNNPLWQDTYVYGLLKEDIS